MSLPSLRLLQVELARFSLMPIWDGVLARALDSLPSPGLENSSPALQRDLGPHQPRHGPRSIGFRVGMAGALPSDSHFPR